MRDQLYYPHRFSGWVREEEACGDGDAEGGTGLASTPKPYTGTINP